MSERLYNGIYDYEALPQTFDGKKIDIYNQSLLEQFSLLTKNWNDELNTEWIARHYMASKIIMSATLMLNSVAHANQKNLRIVEPYLLYYALFSSCRALVLTIPQLKWEDGNVMEYTHQKVINIAVNTIKLFDKSYGGEVNKTLMRAKDYRELFSYKFPSNGIISLPGEVTVSLEETTDLCRLLVEIAKFNSEKLEQSFAKNCKAQAFGFKEAILEKCIWYRTDDYTFVDDEDYYRIGRIVVKEKKPASIYLTMNSGMVDDFFRAWISEEDSDEGAFDPDLNIRIIYDFQ